MKKLKFNPDDFMNHSGHSAALKAQAYFDAWYKENIENAPIIKQWKNPFGESAWFYDQHLFTFNPATHKAKLIDIQEISKCKDCGVETKPGPGSARCKQCWDDKCGVNND